MSDAAIAHAQRWRWARAGVQATSEQFLPHAQVKELFDFANITRKLDAAQGAAARIDFNEFVSLFARGAVPLSYLDTTIGADAVGTPALTLILTYHDAVGLGRLGGGAAAAGTPTLTLTLTLTPTLTLTLTLTPSR